MAVAVESPSILGLADNILQQAKDVTKYYQQKGMVAPTFSPNSCEVPKDADFVEKQKALKASLEDLQRLVEGPEAFYRSFFMLGYDIAAFQIALDFQFFSLVPAEGDISLEDLAAKAGLDLDRASRVIRLLTTQRFFEERKPGFISHNSFSVAMRDDELRALVHYSQDEMLKAAAQSGDSLKANPYTSDSIHCPFKDRHGVPIFEYYARNPEHAGRFARAMAGYRKVENSIIELRDGFPWANLKGTVVDIGGGSGHVDMIMAREFPNLSFNVQDGSADMLAEGEKLLTDDVRGRISFTKANFFQPQQYKGAAAYLMRQCTHNWADHDVVKMFKSVVPALEQSSPDTPFLINDVVVPEAGSVSRLKEREMRQADMVMLVSFGAKQRTQAEFAALLKEADPRYEIRKALDIGALGLLEVYLKH